MSVAHAIARRSVGHRRFGTGYSSLSHLKYLPIDILKIDRSLVSGGVVTEFAVTDEGIETDHQAHYLRQLGCHHGRGYLLGRPVPPVRELRREANEISRAA